MKPTHYQKLGVQKNADKETLLVHLKEKIEQVKEANKNNSSTTLKKIDELLDSYNILINPKTREEYDQWLAIQKSAQKEQWRSQKFAQQVQLYIMMHNPPPFRLYNEKGQAIVTGYYIPEEHYIYFTHPIKVKVKRR